MVHNHDGSFSFPKKTWTRKEIEAAFENIFKREVPKGERQIKLQVICPTPEAAQKFLQEFNQMFKDELEKVGRPVLSNFREITDQLV